MNPLRWKLEHRVAWLLICLIGAMFGVIFAWFQSPFYQISRSSLSGEWANSARVFLIWLPNVGLYWPWPILGATIPGLGFYVFELLAGTPPTESRPKAFPEIVGAFGALMEHYPTAILDSSKLPVSKTQMKRVIKRGWTSTTEERMRNFLEITYVHLSQFQDGVGDEPIDCKLPTDPDPDKTFAILDPYLRFAPMMTKEADSLMAEFKNFKRSKTPFSATGYARTPNEVLDTLSRPFVKLWRGQYTLPVAFWLFFILGTFLAPIVIMMAYIPFYFAGMPQIRPPLSVLAMIIYPIFAAVGVWRSANARPFQRWPVAAAIAKIGVCFWLLGIASRVTGMGFMDLVRLTGYHP